MQSVAVCVVSVSLGMMFKHSTFSKPVQCLFIESFVVSSKAFLFSSSNYLICASLCIVIEYILVDLFGLPSLEDFQLITKILLLAFFCEIPACLLFSPRNISML